MEFIKIPIKYMCKEPKVCNGRQRFSTNAFTRKLPKWVVPCDYSKTEKLIEIEFSDGDRNWFDLSTFFGKVIAEAKEILLLHPDGETESLNIVNVEVFKVKRTMFWKLIFESDLPF